MGDEDRSGDWREEELPADPVRRRRFQWDQRTELITVILLAVASLLAAWCGFQASQWSGLQSDYYSQASSRRIDATHTLTVAYLHAVGDSGLFNGWVEAYWVGDEARMQFYRNRFSDELETAMIAWLETDPLNNPDAPGGPIEMPEYRLAELEQAAQLEEEAERLFRQGQQANERSDAYVLDTVILAGVLFFGGLASKVKWFAARAMTVGIGAAMLVIGLIRLFSLPVA